MEIIQMILNIQDIGLIAAVIFLIQLFTFTALFVDDCGTLINPYKKFSIVGATILILLYLDVSILVYSIRLLIKIIVFVFTKKEKKKETKKSVYNQNYPEGFY